MYREYDYCHNCESYRVFVVDGDKRTCLKCDSEERFDFRLGYYVSKLNPDFQPEPPR